MSSAALLERKAPRADAVHTGAVLSGRRCSCGGVTSPLIGECAACRARRLQRSVEATSAPGMAPPLVREVVGSPGTPLAAGVRRAMESRIGHDFSSVRVHADARAAASARAVGASAYTVGRHVAFGAGRYTPESPAGRSLLLHELTHVVQQRGSSASELRLGPAGDRHEREADRVASGGARPVAGTAPRSVQRQGIITPLGQGGGFGGLMERDRRRSFPPPVGRAAPPAPFQVCSRDLQGALGAIANHAYVDAPPKRFAIIGPLCPNHWSDNPVTGTTAQKWDNSPDPCGKEPRCVPCNPKSGVTDVAACLSSAFAAYASLSLYRGLGPNSNTFAGTLARTCCAGMVPKPAALGNCPGWDDAAAPARAGATPCPPGPTC